MSWVGEIMARRSVEGPELLDLARTLAADESAPASLRALASSYASASLYRADRPRARESDPDTSRAAGFKVRGKCRPGGAVHRLLLAHWRAPAGLTAREAETAASVYAAHKRASELIADGLLRVMVDDDGVEVTRDGGRVLTFTEDGAAELSRLTRAGEATR